MVCINASPKMSDGVAEASAILAPVVRNACGSTAAAEFRFVKLVDLRCLS